MAGKPTGRYNIQHLKNNWDLFVLHMAIRRLSSAELISSCALFTQREESCWLVLPSLSPIISSKENKTNIGVLVQCLQVQDPRIALILSTHRARALTQSQACSYVGKKGWEMQSDLGQQCLLLTFYYYKVKEKLLLGATNRRL